MLPSRRCRPRAKACCPTTARSAAAESQGDRTCTRSKTVIEKPTPTEAEQRLIVPGLRAGHYLCFFGMHVLTPAHHGHPTARIDEPARRQRCHTLVRPGPVWPAANATWRWNGPGWRYDVGVKYGLLTAQLALAPQRPGSR